MNTPVGQLHRVRWAVRFTLTLGVAASVAANILHAQPGPIAQTIAAWPPLAMLLTIELIARVPVDRRILAAARLAAATGIATIAAWVSYWHMAGVAARYGEHGTSPYLLPLSVDGLVMVASVSLVELAGRIRTAETATANRAANASDADQTADPTRALPATVAAATQATGQARPRSPHPSAHAAREAAATTRAVATPVSEAGPTAPAQMPANNGLTDDFTDAASAAREHDDIIAGPAPAGYRKTRSTLTELPRGLEPDDPRAPNGSPQDWPPTDIKAAVAYWRAKDPNLSPADIGRKVGRSRSTVRRILAELANTGDANGGRGGVNGAASRVANSVISY